MESASDTTDKMSCEGLQSEASMHSAATTEPSSPRQPLSPSNSNEPWCQVRAKLIDAAQHDEAVEMYGDIVNNQGAIERFLKAHKGNVDKAFEQVSLHLHWRRDYEVDTITEEDFSDMKAYGELYWTGRDKNGVPTLTWILRKHDGGKQKADRFVRFLVHQIECGMRSLPSYPNTEFNIMVDLEGVGFGNNDPEMMGLLQATLVQNYPKVRKGLYVFPVNWFVHFFWDTIIKPILSTLQPDIEDKICPLRGDFEAELKERFDVDQIEVAFGGTLDLTGYPSPAVLPYSPTSLRSIAVAKAQRVMGEKRASLSAESSTTMKACQKLQRVEISERKRKAVLTRRNTKESDAGSLRTGSYGQLFWITFVIATGSIISWAAGGSEKTNVLAPLMSAAVGVLSWRLVNGASEDEQDGGRNEVNIVKRVKAESLLIDGKLADTDRGAWSWATRYAQCTGF